MIERMLTGGGVSVGESYEAQENGKTITVRSIGPVFRRALIVPKSSEVVRNNAKDAGSQKVDAQLRTLNNSAEREQ
jgi:hypothetical protein